MEKMLQEFVDDLFCDDYPYVSRCGFIFLFTVTIGFFSNIFRFIKELF